MALPQRGQFIIQPRFQCAQEVGGLVPIRIRPHSKSTMLTLKWRDVFAVRVMIGLIPDNGKPKNDGVGSEMIDRERLIDYVFGGIGVTERAESQILLDPW